MTNDTKHITEARRMAMRTIEEWNSLDEEERHGTLHQIVDELAKAEAVRDAEGIFGTRDLKESNRRADVLLEWREEQ